ncbi:MAG: hypothetical protein AAFQ37_10105, partial [Bacteroidota bacterium]
MGDPLVRAGQFAQGYRQVILIGIALLLPRLGVERHDIGAWEQMQYLGYLLGFAWVTGLGQAYLARIRKLDPHEAKALTNSLLQLSLLFACGCLLVVWFLETPFLRLTQGDINPVLPGWGYYMLF